MYFAIEVIGYGKRRRYVIRRVISKTTMTPAVDGKTYATEAAAREAAEKLGIHIETCGDLWEIIHSFPTT